MDSGNRAQAVGFVVLLLFSVLLMWLAYSGKGADIIASIVAPVLLTESK